LRGDRIFASARHSSCSLIAFAKDLLVVRNKIPETLARDVGNDFEGRVRRCTSILAKRADGVFRNKREGIFTTTFGGSEVPHQGARVKWVVERQNCFELTTRGSLGIVSKDDGIWIGSIRSVGAKGIALFTGTSSRSWIAAATTEGSQVRE
jgi:hypothetical protein